MLLLGTCMSENRGARRANGRLPRAAVFRGSMQCGKNFSGIATVSREDLANALALTLAPLHTCQVLGDLKTPAWLVYLPNCGVARLYARSTCTEGCINHRLDVEALRSWQLHCTTNNAQIRTISAMLSMETHLGRLSEASRIPYSNRGPRLI